MRTTRPPSYDIALEFPALAPLARMTVRLHPRPAEVPIDASRIGGRFRWPATVDWPRCALPHMDWSRVPSSIPPDGRPHVSVLQLRRADVPELDFPLDTDVFQLLWCPNDHDDPLYVASASAHWWREGDLVDTVPPTPHPDSEYLPRTCSVDPERVSEYPNISDLPDGLRESIHASEGSAVFGPRYEYLLSSAPGTKVGGHPNWFQEPEWPSCDAGHRMDHLLTIDDTEFDGGTWPRWLPIEEEHVWQGPTDERLRVQTPTALHLMGSLYIFICRACDHLPIAQVYQR